MTDKTPNYTKAQEAEMVENYTAAETDAERKNVVANLALEYGKSEGSIRAKLVSLEVYKKLAYVGKTGKKPVRKSAIVTQIAAAIGADEDSVGSLEAATKEALKLVLAAVTPKTDSEVTAD